MKIAAISTHDYYNNKVFSDIGKSVKMENYIISRQDANSGLKKLKELFDKNKIILKTEDLYKKDENIDIEFHINGSFEKKTNAKIMYCILPEIYLVDKKCSPKLLDKKYDKIFTNIEDDIDNVKFIELQTPQGFNKTPIIKTHRPKLACIVASNKNLNRYSKNSGYVMRVKLINWVNKNKKHLDVYGPDWNLFFSSNYYINRLLKFFQKRLNFSFNRRGIFKGVCQDKCETMKQYKFAFCFENVYDINGYFTGGLFDSLFNGCIPIYLGPKNVNKYIPENCFIDFRKFSDFESLYNYLENISVSDYFNYIDNINIFLKSEKFKIFTPDQFANRILNQVMKEKI